MFIRPLLLLLDRATKMSAAFRLIGPAGVVAILLAVWWQLPEAPPFGEDSAKTDATRRVVETVAPALPPMDIEKRLLILPFEHDSTFRVTGALREAFAEDASQYVSVPDQLAQRFVNKWHFLWRQTPAPVRLDDFEQASGRARRAGADFAMTGRVRKVTPEQVAFDLALIDATTGREVSRHTFSSDTWRDLADSTDSGVWNSGHYILAVVVFAFLWPLLLLTVIRGVLKAENNGLTLVALIVIAAAPIVLAYPWAMIPQATIPGTLAFVLGCLVEILWCLYVTSKVAETIQY